MLPGRCVKKPTCTDPRGGGGLCGGSVCVGGGGCWCRALLLKDFPLSLLCPSAGQFLANPCLMQLAGPSEGWRPMDLAVSHGAVNLARFRPTPGCLAKISWARLSRWLLEGVCGP